MIKSTKRCLKKVLFNSKLNYEELLTVMKEIENVINNRPLTFMYDDVNQELLTPNKLLFGRNLETVAPNDVIENESCLTKRAKYIQTVIEHWWNRWHDEYLIELREHHKHKSKNGLLHPNVGDVVLIGDEKAKRSTWRMGRIIELIKSKDSNIRSADVTIAKTGRVIRRPINKLYPLVQE